MSTQLTLYVELFYLLFASYLWFLFRFLYRIIHTRCYIYNEIKFYIYIYACHRCVVHEHAQYFKVIHSLYSCLQRCFKWTCVRSSVWTLICDRPSILYSRRRDADTDVKVIKKKLTCQSSLAFHTVYHMDQSYTHENCIIRRDEHHTLFPIQNTDHSGLLHHCCSSAATVALHRTDLVRGHSQPAYTHVGHFRRRQPRSVASGDAIDKAAAAAAVAGAVATDELSRQSTSVTSL